MIREICPECKKNYAVWCYMPGYISGESPYFCDDCVSRGCSCNEYSVVNEHYHPPGGIHPDDEDGTEGVNWEWVEPGVRWVHIDEKGRRYPCAEYDYDPDGYERDINPHEYETK